MKRYYRDAFGDNVPGELIVGMNGNTAVLVNGWRRTMDSAVADEIKRDIQAEMAAYNIQSPNTIRPSAA